MSEGLKVVLLLSGIFTLVFGGIGAFVFIKFLSARRKGEASRNWPVASGTIRYSSINSTTSTDSDGISSTTYAPIVSYDYEVFGSSFQGNRIGFGLSMSGSYSGAANIATRYITGMPVQVFYNPDKPEEAVLEHSVINKGPTILFFSVFLAVGIGAFLTGLWIIISTILIRL